MHTRNIALLFAASLVTACDGSGVIEERYSVLVGSLSSDCPLEPRYDPALGAWTCPIGDDVGARADDVVCDDGYAFAEGQSTTWEVLREGHDYHVVDRTTDAALDGIEERGIVYLRGNSYVELLSEHGFVDWDVVLERRSEALSGNADLTFPLNDAFGGCTLSAAIEAHKER